MTDFVSKNNSVEKGLELLECFNHAHPFLTLEELVEKTGFPKTTTFRLLKSLEKYGYIKSHKRYKETLYSLGWAFLSKSNIVLNQLNIREQAHDDMVRLRNETGLMVQLVIRDGEEAVYIDQIESLNPIKIYPQVGRRAPLYAAACPRTLLAFLSLTEQERILNQIDYSLYPRIPKKERLQEELLHVKEKGIAISYGELHEGTIAVASPILISDQDVIAAISVAGLEREFVNKGDLDQCIDLVRETATRLSKKIQVRI
ncbi:IclR family transcriptional regulator [Pullulanibacillus sp. KACC 23026]|uniref:IclR family transcriptional regulator n=1 Tax=Pullulanibacillus sp. KACC 23026 TaxID=3028315 RepID=UPI0023AF6685|nr:IclR family transcriptional regulator [Pullulanibacillus sp. KACC 23026]WEG11069.1 IclR family transcriptional regulator [Pullulanibacillus sp. KACC 23026]